MDAVCVAELKIYIQQKQIWNIKKNGVGDRNGFIRIRLKDNLPNKYTLAYNCLLRKAERQFREKPYILRIAISTIKDMEPDADVVTDDLSISRNMVQNSESDIIGWLIEKGSIQ